MKRTLLLILCWTLFVSYEGCATAPKIEPIVYRDVPANSIVVFDGVTSWTYNLDEWMAVKRETQKAIFEMISDKDQQLRECLERERIKD